MPSSTPHCWCSNVQLLPFSPTYLRCSSCETLVTAQMPEPGFFQVTDNDHGFYGREYWFAYQENDLSLPNILSRSRTDLAERCLFWLRTTLKYQTPPGRALEIGCAHGGFVALLRWAGFDATGLELSPWIVHFAQEAFAIPVLLGPVETQALEPASLDLIAMMDVFEHLSDPVATVRHCLTLLKPDGVLMIQTPQYEVGKTYEEMVSRNDSFLELFKEQGHVYLFSQRAMGEFLRRVGVQYIEYEPAIFGQYDMFVIASRQPLTVQAQTESEERLVATPHGRMVQAMLGLDQQRRTLLEEHHTLQARYAESEADRAARLHVIEQQGAENVQLQRELHEQLEKNTQLQQQLAETVQLQSKLDEQLEKNTQLQQQLAETTRVSVLSRETIEVQRRQIVGLSARLHTAEQTLHSIMDGHIYKLLRRLGRWEWVEHGLASQQERHLRIPLVPEEVTKELDGTLAAQSLSVYRTTIDAFNANQPNSKLLNDIRAYNHFMIDALNSVSPLRGKLVLDVGASPHGYALEHALDCGAALYMGIGLDIASPQSVRGEQDNVGLLLNMDATLLQFPAGMFDAVFSISTFEHVNDVTQTLAEIDRVLGPDGVALLSFEPVWSCSYGHHLHHFGACARLIPPWAHLMWTPDQMRGALAQKWPVDAPLSLDQAIEWIYQGDAINRVDIRQFKDLFETGPLKVESMVPLKDESIDQTTVLEAAAVSGFTVEELTTKGLSVVLRKKPTEQNITPPVLPPPQGMRVEQQTSREAAQLAQLLSQQYHADPTLFATLEAHGFHVTPVHFYSPIPDVSTLSREDWNRPSELVGIDVNEAGQLQFLEQTCLRFKSEYDGFPQQPTDVPHQYYFDQAMFRSVDAEVLYCMTRQYRPRHIIEVGSGFSTYVTATAVTRNAAEGDAAELLAIEPYPNEVLRRGFPGLSQLLTQPVQKVDPALFDRLGQNDILFIDSSHVFRVDSDVRFLFLEVLPRINPGVLIHIHDIFLPHDYPREWIEKEHRFWNEQYLLQAFLLFNRGFEVLWAGSYMHTYHSDKLKEAFASYDRTSVWPGSFWMRRRSV